MLALLFSLSCFFYVQASVIELKGSEFESKIAEWPLVFVKFYAPWCGHCKALAPKYDQAAEIIAKSGEDIKLVKVDCTTETEICTKHGVNGYPTLKVFKKGVAEDYNGAREANAIVKYLRDRSGPSSTTITESSQLERILSRLNMVAVAFLKKDSSLFSTFSGVADKLRDSFSFAHSYSKIEKYEPEDVIYLFRPKKLHSKFEDKVLKYTGKIATVEIEAWLVENAVGIAGVRDSDNLKYFQKHPLVVAYYNVDYEKDPKGTNYIRNRIMKVGKQLLNSGKEMHFGISNSMEMSHELNEYGVSEPNNKKVYVVATDTNGKNYVMQEEFSVKTFEQFLKDFLSEKLTPFLKSEEIPEKNDDPVKVVVAKSFSDIVDDPTKDVLIEFYAPWCGHCKSLAPKYEELAKKLSGESEIVIAKMDATANHVPKQYNVKGFPTIYFAPKNNKESPMQYTGGREVDAFVKYIAEHSTNELKGFDRSGNTKKSEL